MAVQSLARGKAQIPSDNPSASPRRSLYRCDSARRHKEKKSARAMRMDHKL